MTNIATAGVNHSGIPVSITRWLSAFNKYLLICALLQPVGDETHEFDNS